MHNIVSWRDEYSHGINFTDLSWLWYSLQNISKLNIRYAYEYK